jgi:TRAP-type C4-dicarboxylate transport system permease small subunit
MKILTKIISVLSIVFHTVSNICFVGIMLFIVCDVLLRYVLNMPILGSFEIVEQLMLFGVFSAFAYAQMKGAHIHVSMLLRILPRKLALVMHAVGELLSAGIGGILCYCMFLQVQLALEKHYTTAVLKLTLVPSYVIITGAAGIFCLTLLLSSIKSFIAISNETYGSEIVSTWN